MRTRNGPADHALAAPPRARELTVEALDATLHARGVRRSSVRTAILAALVQAQGHVSAEQLTERVRAVLPRVSLSTVYRTLDLLVRVGLAQARGFGDGHARFELVGAQHHDHLVCTRCGAVVEFVDDEIEQLQELVATLHGFEIAAHELELYGVCPRCRPLDA